ncbi:MAG: NFACT family protein [Candidatus Gastranaerophilales bacterium]|nr:NFACT family protein [Candidatus Gastranaerophilales bacterium]
MINFDFLILKLFVEENIGFLEGARIQKIQQPTRQELVFSIRNKGESRKFYININPKFFHLCFMSEENQAKRFIEIPQKPPMFCMLLRKYLESSRVAKVFQPEEERILEFYFETYNEVGEKIYLCLAIELMGKHSNVVLYNYDTNVIIGCAHNVGSDKSRERELIGGLPYVYPVKSKNKSFSGLSTVLYEIPSPLGGEGRVGGKKCPINQFIDNYFADIQEKEKIKSIKSKLLTVNKAKLKKVKTTLEKIQKQATTSQKADLYRKKGDLIIANLFDKQDFVSAIEVVDYETNSPLKIELDKTKTLKENANQYYKLYNKAKTAFSKTNEIIENLKQEKEYLEQVLYSIESATTVVDLLEIAQEETGNREQGTAVGRAYLPDSKKQKAKSEKRKEERERKPSVSSLLFPLSSSPLTAHCSQFTVYVGKNNKQNDYIVSKLARDEDLWFHVHNCAGSHVLLRVEAGQEITDEVIFECAKLAKQYSSAKDSTKVGVIYTKAKNLKKPPGAKLGYVTYKGEKEIVV